MRRLVASAFVSLDGVMQAPGGPDEDPSGGFAHGGWTFPYWDPDIDISAAGFDGAGRELVLGRRTYEIFAAYWPYQGDDNPVARQLNAARKHVASRTLRTLDWAGATLLDEYNGWTYPVVLGRGKRLFEPTARPGALRLVHTAVSTTGVVMSRYEPAGEIPTGSFADDTPSDRELARREKHAREDAGR